MQTTPRDASVSANALVSAGPPITMNGRRSRAIVSASATAATASFDAPVPGKGTRSTRRP